MTVNGYSPFVATQNKQRTNAHEYKEKGTINQPPHRSAIFWEKSSHSMAELVEPAH